MYYHRRRKPVATMETPVEKWRQCTFASVMSVVLARYRAVLASYWEWFDPATTDPRDAVLTTDGLARAVIAASPVAGQYEDAIAMCKGDVTRYLYQIASAQETAYRGTPEKRSAVKSANSGRLFWFNRGFLEKVAAGRGTTVDGLLETLGLDANGGEG